MVDVLTAAETSCWEEVPTRIALGDDVNAANSWGAAPLHFAAISGKDDVIRALLAAGAVPCAVDRYDESASDWALQNGRRDAAVLLNAAADTQRSVTAGLPIRPLSTLGSLHAVQAALARLPPGAVDHGGLFEDDDFPITSSSLPPPLHDAKWLRLREICPAQPILYSGSRVIRGSALDDSPILGAATLLEAPAALIS